MLDFDMLCIPFVDSACMVRFRVNEARFGTGVRNLRFTLEDQLTGERREVCPRGRRIDERKVEFTANFPKYKDPGPYTWYVTVERRDDRRKFEGEFVLFVNRLEDARKAATQVYLTVNNNIKAGPASDVNLNVDAAEALDGILKSPEDPLDALRRLVYGRERAWEKVELFEVMPEECPTPKQVNPLPDGPARLTLKCGDAAIQLLSDRSVSFGRHKENMIPLIIFGPDGRKDIDSSEWISRFHFRIELAERCFVIYDGPSTNGTWVDNKELRKGESFTLRDGRVVRVDVGRSAKSLVRRYLELEFGFFRDSAGRSSGFVMTRRDGVPMKVVCVAEGGEVPVDDCRVSWNGHSWMLLRGRSPAVPIVVGSSVTIGEKTYEALPFHKTHIN